MKAHWDFSQPASLEVNPETRLPESLLQLRGPLNGERIKLLWWLIRQGASLPKFYTWEVSNPSPFSSSPFSFLPLPFPFLPLLPSLPPSSLSLSLSLPLIGTE